MKRILGYIIFIVLTLGLAVSLAYYAKPVNFDIIYWGKKSVYWPLLNMFKDTILSPLFIGFFAFILILQKKYPVKPDQKIFSVGFAYDTIYFVLDTIFRIMIVLVYASILRSLFDKYVPFLRIHMVGTWPESVRFIWGVFVLDFTFWFHHWLRHVVPWFWQFHTIHHSQKEMNLFTDHRYHFVEYLITNFINVLVLSIFAVGVPQIVAFEIFRQWYTRLYHANIKSNYGILRFVLVTPQSHRIHHSCEPRHQDKNFGVLFSIWDHMFGTQYRNYDEYPDTGIEDEEFPVETTAKGLNVVTVILQQHIYPFIKIGRSLLGKEKTK